MGRRTSVAPATQPLASGNHATNIQCQAASNIVTRYIVTFTATEWRKYASNKMSVEPAFIADSPMGCGLDCYFLFTRCSVEMQLFFHAIIGWHCRSSAGLPYMGRFGKYQNL